MKELKDIIDELDILTLFQKDFCKRIIWFTINKGEFKYIKSYIYKLYERIMTPDEIEREIKNMASIGGVLVNARSIYGQQISNGALYFHGLLNRSLLIISISIIAKFDVFRKSLKKSI